MKRLLGWVSMANIVKLAASGRIYYRLGWEAPDGTMVNVWQSYSLDDCIARREHLLGLGSSKWRYRPLLITSHLDRNDLDPLFGEGVYG